MARDASVIARLAKYDYGDDEMIAIRDTVRPEEFQRKLRQRTWDTFVPALFGRVILMEVRGKLIMVDGQHRLDYAKRKGETHVPSIVFRKGTMKDAAAMFDLFNTERVALKAADGFRAACVSGDRGKLALDAGLAERDLDGWCMGRARYNLTSIGSVVGLCDQTGLEHTLYTLDVLRDCWSWDVESSPHVRCIRGFGQFLRSEKKVTAASGRLYARRWNPENRDLLTSYIATNFPGKVGLRSILAVAQQKSLGGGGGGGSLGMERVLADTLRDAKKDWSSESEAA